MLLFRAVIFSFNLTHLKLNKGARIFISSYIKYFDLTD